MFENLPCLFSARAIDEAAQAVAALLSPGASMDVVEAVATSRDFTNDIPAIIHLDDVIRTMTAELRDVTVSEEFNPIYLPTRMSAVDEAMELNPRNDAFRFTGMDGNPYTIKLVDVSHDDTTLIVGKAVYHPFELPGYNDVSDFHEHPKVN